MTNTRPPHKSGRESRREFLEKLSALAGGAVLLANAPWLSKAVAVASGTQGPDDVVRIGLIGVGSRGKALLGNLLKSTQCRVVAVCDDYPAHLERAIRLAGSARGFSDYRAMLDWRQFDAVAIATHLSAHAPIALDALDAGVHVFCEKAMARTINDCLAMVTKAKAARRVLQIGHQRMFSPHYLEIAERVHRGDLGKVTQIRAYWHRNHNWRRPVPAGSGLERKINWRLYRDTSGGLITELGSHQVQVANWLFKDAPRRVIGSGSLCYWRDGREVDDQIALIYDYSDGRKLIYDCMINNRLYGVEEQIMGDKGTIEAELARFYPDVPPPTPGLQQLLRDISSSRFSPVPIGGASWQPETKLRTQGEAITPRSKEHADNETLLQFDGFASAVRAGRPLPGLLRHAFDASVACLLGEQAMATGTPMEWTAALQLPDSAFEP
jgi:predicted dehydrogenase